MKTSSFFSAVLFDFVRVSLTFFGLILLIPVFLSGQNIGIGTANPTEKLQVAGKIFSSEEGFRFPDGSVQTRAYNTYEAQDAGEVRWIIIMDIVNPPIPGSFTFDTLVNKIKILDYQWGMTVTPGGGGGGGEVINKTLKIIKNIDGSTNVLLQKAINGQNLAEIWLYFFRQLPNDEVQLYYKINIKGILVLEWDQHGVFIGGEHYSHLDFIGFQFEEATWFYEDGIFNNNAHYFYVPISK